MDNTNGKLITLCEYLKIAIPSGNTTLASILMYLINEVDSNPAKIAKDIIVAFAGSSDLPMETFIEAEYEQEGDIACELCGKPLANGLWRLGQHVECSAEWAEVQASGHMDHNEGEPA